MRTLAEAAPTELILTAVGALIAAAAIHKLRAERRAHKRTLSRLAGVQSRLSVAIDSRREVESVNEFLRGRAQRLSDELAEANYQIGQREAELADAQEKIAEANGAIGRLLQALNSANVRCAEQQQALQRNDLTAEAAYFLVALGDGTIAGPFSRN